MHNNFPANAADLGDAALQQTIQNAEKACEHEKRRRELANEFAITQCKARLKVLSDERDELREIVRRTVQSGDDSGYRRAYFISVAAILGFAGFAFAHLALAPFGVAGWVVWAYAVALAVVGAVSTDLVLEKYGHRHVVGALCLTAFITSIIGITILATVRADVLVLFLKGAVGGNEGDGIRPEDAAIFYRDSAPKLRLFFGLLSVGMEITTGLAIFEARKISRDAERLRKRLAEIQDLMIGLAARIVMLTNEPAALEQEFWAKFWSGVLGAVRKNTTPPSRIVGCLLFALLFAHNAHAEPPFVIVGVDFSKSEVSANAYGSQEHEKDIAAATRILKTLPPGSEFRVIGITDRSFSRPRVLLAGTIPTDHGPLEFVDRVALARSRFAAQLQPLAKSVELTSKTDLFGFFMLSSQLFPEASERNRVLIVFSDMRNSSPPSDIESPRVVPVASILGTLQQQKMLPNLHGVSVFICGVHSSGKDAPYFATLSTFWRRYFAKAGAELHVFSMERSVLDWSRVAITSLSGAHR